jgi:hypothetical protein
MGNKMDFSDLVATLSDISILLPFFVLLRRWAVVKGSHFIMVLYVLITFVRNILSTIIEIIRNTNELDLNTVFLYNVHSIFNFWIISYLYFRLLNGKFWRYFIIVSNIVLLGFALYDFETLSNWNTERFNDYSYPIAGFFTIILLLQYFFQLLKKLEVPRLSDFPLFWFSSGALIYYSGTFFMYLVIHTVNTNHSLGRLYWPIDAILSITFHILVAIATWKVRPDGV